MKETIAVYFALAINPHKREQLNSFVTTLVLQDVYGVFLQALITLAQKKQINKLQIMFA